MNDKGFVKLNRSIKDKPWYGDNGTMRMYITLLINAAWRDLDYDGMTLHKGQYVTSIAKLGEMCGLTIRQTRTALSHLKATKDITVQTTAKYSIVTLNSYDVQPPAAKSVDNLADKHPDTVSDNISRSKEEEKKEIKKEEKEEAAAPLPTPLSSDNSFDKMPNDNPVTQDELTAMYGKENVAVYSRKFEIWAERKGIKGVNKLGTIAKWLAEDGGTKQRSSSFDQRDVMCNLLHKYRRPVDNDG